MDVNSELYNIFNLQINQIMIFKIAFKNQIRLFNPKDTLSLDNLHHFILKNYKNLDKYTLYYEDEQGDHINIDTQDDLEIFVEQQDKKPKIYIKVEGQEEEQNSFQPLNESSQSGQPQTKVRQHEQWLGEQKKVEKKEEALQNVGQKVMEKDQEKPEHMVQKKVGENEQKKDEHRVSCDSCRSSPIIGDRYKCAVCQDFDLCNECQKRIKHKHPMIKIRQFFQAPLSCKVVFEKPIEPIPFSLEKTKLVFESSAERYKIVISYLQDLLGIDEQGQYIEFASGYRPTFVEDILQDYIKWQDAKNNRPSIPKMFNWIKNSFKNLVQTFNSVQVQKKQ